MLADNLEKAVNPRKTRKARNKLKIDVGSVVHLSGHNLKRAIFSKLFVLFVLLRTNVVFRINGPQTCRITDANKQDASRYASGKSS
jgi:hypothetical protein